MIRRTPVCGMFVVCVIVCGINSVISRADDAILQVYPAQVQLSSVHEGFRLIAVLQSANGVTSDVTERVEFTLDTPDLAELRGPILIGKQPGSMRLTAVYQGLVAAVAVQSTAVPAEHVVGFQRDLIPIFTRYGCNSGTCHGASRGQDGFRLSLFGFDPAGDYHRLTREMATRRILPGLPEESLVLTKATGSVAHTGGKRFEVDSQAYQSIQRWLQQGAAWDAQAPPVVELQLYPPEVVFGGQDQMQQCLAIASYADGTQRDVTDLAVFLSRDESVASVTPGGLIRAHQRGESFVTARFGVHTVGIPVVVLPPTVDFAPATDAHNDLDAQVLAKLNKLRIAPGSICSDEEFLRRATIDTIGLLPTVEEYEAFMQDPDPNRREKLVDRLLAQPEFQQLWAAKWADLLMIREIPVQVSRKQATLYFEWLRQQFADGQTLRHIAAMLLTARGNAFDQPAATFYSIEPDQLKTAENIAQLFLGIRLQCAQCHNHPFDRWTMDDYYAFADFVSGVRRKQHEDYRQWIIFDSPAETRHPVTGAVVTGRFLGEAPPQEPIPERRQALADWITSDTNPYFHRTMANRVWAHFLGRGIVEPVDDVRVANPPSNAALYDLLAAKLLEYDYDLKRLARDILLSATYQRRVARPGEEHDLRNFSHAAVRRIPASELLDILSQVTESPEKLAGLPLGARAVEAWDHAPESYFLTTFGRSQRTSVCACESKAEPTLSQALHLINGSTIQEKIKQGQLIARRLQEGQSQEAIIQEIYLRCLTRRPTSSEQAAILEQIGKQDDPQVALEDVFWSVLNSREFLFNH